MNRRQIQRPTARLARLAGPMILTALLAGCEAVSWPQATVEPSEPPAPEASGEILEQSLEAPPAEAPVEAQAEAQAQAPAETPEQAPKKSLFGSLLGTLKGALAQTPEETPVEGSADAGAAPDPVAGATAALPVPQPGAAPTPVAAGPVPHIYMALQPDGEGKPISVIFAIDAARDNTPSDDPAIRLTPENGQCNPQEMRNYNFPAKYLARPITSEFERAQGLTAADLPAYLAISVTDEMVATGLASNREETRAHNICTRKLWEELLQSEN